MYSLGGGVWKKALENKYWVEMYVHSPISHGQLKEKKQTDNFQQFGCYRGWKKMPREGLKNEVHFCFVFNKRCDIDFYMHF